MTDFMPTIKTHKIAVDHINDLPSFVGNHAKLCLNSNDCIHRALATRGRLVCLVTSLLLLSRL